MQGQVNAYWKNDFTLLLGKSPQEESILYKLQTIFMEHANNLKKDNTEV